jgi:hypothetical protein
VVGLDLSARGTAGVYIPGDWAWPAWHQLETFRVGYPAGQMAHLRRVERLADIAAACAKFVAASRAQRVFVEDYAGGLAGNSGNTLAEIGGAVKARLWSELGVCAVPVGQSTVRRFFLNGIKVPKGKGQMNVALARECAALGMPWDDTDRRDAMLVASYGRTEMGLPGLLARG